MKKFDGTDIEIVDSTARNDTNNLINDTNNLKSRFVFSTQGQIVGLVGTGNKLYLISAMRLSTNVGAMWVVHNYQNSVKIKPISVDSQMKISANNLGTIEVQYNNDRTNVFVSAVELKS